MAGINRLGKGAAKPGTLRPADPNRFKTEDFFSVEAEDDPEYLRRIVEVEQLAAQKQGAVLARGAFDRDDALYLQDEAEKARHKELELRDAEMGKFTRLRSEVDIDSGAKGDDMWLSSSTYKRAKLVKPRIAVKAAGAGAHTSAAPSHESSDRASNQDGTQQLATKAAPKENTPAGQDSSKTTKGNARVQATLASLTPAGLDLGYASSTGSESEGGGD